MMDASNNQVSRGRRGKASSAMKALGSKLMEALGKRDIKDIPNSEGKEILRYPLSGVQAREEALALAITAGSATTAFDLQGEWLNLAEELTKLKAAPDSIVKTKVLDAFVDSTMKLAKRDLATSKLLDELARLKPEKTTLSKLRKATTGSITQKRTLAKEVQEKDKGVVSNDLKTRLKFSRAAHSHYTYSTVEGNQKLVGLNPNIKGKAQEFLEALKNNGINVKKTYPDGRIITNKGVILKIHQDAETGKHTLSFGGTSASTYHMMNVFTSKTTRHQWTKVNIPQNFGALVDQDKEVIEVAKLAKEQGISSFAGHSLGGKAAIIASCVTQLPGYADNPATIESGLEKELITQMTQAGMTPEAIDSHINSNIFTTSDEADRGVSLNPIGSKKFFGNHLVLKTSNINPLGAGHVRTDKAIEQSIKNLDAKLKTASDS